VKSSSVLTQLLHSGVIECALLIELYKTKHTVISSVFFKKQALYLYN